MRRTCSFQAHEPEFSPSPVSGVACAVLSEATLPRDRRARESQIHAVFYCDHVATHFVLEEQLCSNSWDR